MALIVSSGASASEMAGNAAIAAGLSAARIRADVEFLAHDLLEGREAGTRGYDLAALYVASQLEAAGFEPAGDEGSYLQQVPLIESTLTASSLRVSPKGQPPVAISIPDEGLVAASHSRAQVDLTAPIVFAGYGVTAPGLNHDDYAGIDAKGKIVALLYNAPASFPSEQRAHYASIEQKARNAADHGAVGVVVVFSDDALKQFPWQMLTAAYHGKPSFTWAKPDGTPGTTEPRLQGGAYLNPSGAAKLFASAPFTFDEAIAAAAKGTSRSADLNATMTFSATTAHRRVSSPNVVARLEGSDPALAKTTVVLTAHLDHTGVASKGEGDRINNGAYDNALGSALVLEVARALGAASDRPKRSVVVALVTAEEKGLLGSDYFARYPPASVGTMVANVNLDMPLFLAASKDLVAFGAENSTLEAVVRSAAEKAGYTLSPDPMPDQNIFVRSDQYSLVKQGVPAVMLMPGLTAADPKINGPEVFGGFLAKHYHRPSDDVSLPMDLKALEKFAYTNLLIVRAVADNPVAPGWKPGNFFGQTFGKTE